MLFMLFISVYTLGFFFEYFSQDSKTVFCGGDFCQIGYSFSVLTLFVLVLDYTGKVKFLRSANLALLYIIPIIGIGLRWADKCHHLLRDDVLTKGQFVAVSTPFAGLMFLEDMMVIIVVFMLIKFYQKANPQARKQLIGIVAAIMILLAVETIKPIRPDLILVIPLTSIMLTLIGIILFGCIFRLQLFSVVPVPGERIIESIQEGIIEDLAAELKMFKKQESSLENTMLQNKQLEAIIKIMPDIASLAISDHEGNYIRNSKAANGFTYQKGAFFYKDGREIDNADMPQLRVLRGEEVSDFHFSIKNKKNERHYLFNGSPIYDQQGNLSCGVFFILEITEQVLHQRLIPVKEQLEALNSLKDKLFTVVTHDIRNPMATMISLIELLEGEKETYGSETMEIIEAVKEQVNNIYTIVENLLEWLKSQQKGLVCNPLVWDLSGIVQEVINEYQINAGIKNINITSGILEGTNVFADKDILNLVLRNLLSNAIKFTDNGGIISIQAWEAGKEIIVAVRDNGIGMSQAKRESLFQEAYVNSTRGTAGEKGIGLGLLICKEFVLRNGGQIWVDSTLGKGSIFRFSLLNSDKMTIQK